MAKRATRLTSEAPTPISCAAIDALDCDAHRLRELIAISGAPSFERSRPIDHRWIDVLRALDGERKLTAGGLSIALGLGMEELQPVLMKMTRCGLIQATASGRSARAAQLALTSHGKLEAERLVPLYDAIDSLISYLVAVHAPDLGAQLRRLVEALEAEPFETRLLARLR